MNEKGEPIIKERSKRFVNVLKALNIVLRIVWGTSGIVILYVMYTKCLYMSQGCNNFVVAPLCFLALVLLQVAGLPCHKLISFFSKQ